MSDPKLYNIELYIEALKASKISVTFSGNTGFATRTTSERFLSARMDEAFRSRTKRVKSKLQSPCEARNRPEIGPKSKLKASQRAF